MIENIHFHEEPCFFSAWPQHNQHTVSRFIPTGRTSPILFSKQKLISEVGKQTTCHPEPSLPLGSQFFLQPSVHSGPHTALFISVLFKSNLKIVLTQGSVSLRVMWRQHSFIIKNTFLLAWHEITLDCWTKSRLRWVYCAFRILNFVL